jgi:hypothetical protein
VSECGREASILRRPWPTGGCQTIEKKEPQGIENFAHLNKCPKNFSGLSLFYIKQISALSVFTCSLQ